MISIIIAFILGGAISLLMLFAFLYWYFYISMPEIQFDGDSAKEPINEYEVGQKAYFDGVDVISLKSHEAAKGWFDAQRLVMYGVPCDDES